MKSLHRLLLYLLVASLISCEKKTKISPGCYKAIVINDLSHSCDYVVQITGGDIGETWEGVKNCLHIKNLPNEARKKGSVLFFSSYQDTTGPLCFADVAYPPKSIIIDNYTRKQCPEQ